MKPQTHILHTAPSDDSVSTTFRESTNDITIASLRKGGLLDMPLGQAAKALKVSTGSLKRTSKSLGLARWPYRQRNSLRQLMANAVEYMDDSMDQGSRKAVLATLQRELDDVQGISGNGIAESTRRFRQTIFKLNHEAKKKQQRRKGNAGGRRAVLDHVKFCVDPVSPTSISHDTAEARSQQLSQPGAMGGGGFAGPPEESLLAEKHDFISGPPEFQVGEEDVPSQTSIPSPEGSTCFQPPFKSPFLPKLDPRVVYRGRPLWDETSYHLPSSAVAPRLQNGLQFGGAAVNHGIVLDTHKNQPTCMPGAIMQVKEDYYPNPPPPELRWLVHPNDQAHYMKPQGTHMDSAAGGPRTSDIEAVNDAHFAGTSHSLTPHGGPDCDDAVCDMTDFEIFSALDLL